MVAEPQLSITRDDIWDLLNFSPTAAQRDILDCCSRQILVLGGFRGGKSRTMSMAAVLLTIQFIAKFGARAGGQVGWVVAQDYERARAAWNHPDGSLSVDLQKVGMLKFVSASLDPGTMQIFVPGSDKPFIIRTKSAKDESSLGMESPVWILLEEAAHTTKDVQERLYSRTSEARKRWGAPFGTLLMSGTSEGSEGWYPALWTSWQSAAIQDKEDAQSFSLPSHSNTFIYPLGEQDPEILQLKATLSERVFNERHLGIPTPPVGLVHPAFDRDVHIQTCEYMPELPLWLAIDPGYSGMPSNYCVAAWQYQEGQWRAIDEVWMNKFVNPNFTHSDIIEECKMRPWWSSVRRNKATAWIDISAERHSDANIPAVTMWRKIAGLTVLSKKVSIKAGMDRMDTMLKINPYSEKPNSVISPRCELAISEFGAGPNPQTGAMLTYKWPTKSDGTVTGAKPTDAHNDFIKASTYLFMNLLGPVGQEPGARKTVRSSSVKDRLAKQGIY